MLTASGAVFQAIWAEFTLANKAVSEVAGIARARCLRCKFVAVCAYRGLNKGLAALFTQYGKSFEKIQRFVELEVVENEVVCFFRFLFRRLFFCGLLICAR